MIDISNLRIEKKGDWTKLVADISSDFERSDREDTMWIAVRNENADMLTAEVYNSFLLFPVYMAMYYKSDIHLHGNVSKILYKNVVTYLQPIMRQFSPDLCPVDIIVDGYGEAGGDHGIIGTGISGGVDCLSTIYTHYQLESDKEDKINGLFMLNCGWHGEFYDARTKGLFFYRCIEMERIAEDLGIPFYQVDSNLHAFLRKLGDRCSYFRIYSCIFALERGIGKYFIASAFSYQEILKWNRKSRDKDWAEYADSYALPLLKSRNLEIVSDGCQYTRSQKTELISDWTIAQKYLNVCCTNETAGNCSCCHKCIRTLLPLDAMGKLDRYSVPFDLKKYRKLRFRNQCMLAIGNNRDAFSTDNYHFCKEHGMKIPSKIVARIYMFPKLFPRYCRKCFKLAEQRRTEHKVRTRS